MFYFDPLYFIILAPALLLMMWAQYRVRSAYSHGMQLPSRLSGAAAARHILDQAGLNDIPVEEIGGHLTDHYDPRNKVLRLSTEVYRTPSLAAVGIAAHEAGHAIQDARGYLPLVLRNAAVPAATFGPWLSVILFVLGMLLHSPHLIQLGLLAYAGILVFQLINLPVEFDASNRAKGILSELQIVDAQGALVVRDVLNAAAWTYVAGALQTLLTLVYYIIRFSGSSRDE
jgi:Zn-dependent membrane protease YugP